MKAGRLSHRVKLQQLTAGQDAAGQPTQVWADVATIWADIVFLTGIQAVKSDAPVSVSRCSVRIRYRAGVTAAQRLLEVSTGVVYDIRAVLPDSTGNRSLDLVCEQGANEG